MLALLNAMDTSMVLTLLFGLLSIIIAVTIAAFSLILWFHNQAKAAATQAENERKIEELRTLLNMERQHFSWEAILEACRALADRLRIFKPHIIVTTPGTPMTVASLVVEALHQLIPMHIIYVSARGIEPFPTDFDSTTHTALSSTSMTWFVPLQLLEQADARIVVIDDLTFNSVYFDRLLELLQQKKIKRENILTASLIASSTVAKTDSLNWRYFTVVNTSIYLPWGLDRGNTPNNHLGRL